MDSMRATADGSRLAFIRWRNPGSVYVAHLEASKVRITTPRRLTLSEGQELPTSWTPDSNAIIFESNLASHKQIFKQSVDKDTPQPLAPPPENPVSTRVSAAGKGNLYLLFSRMSRPSPSA